VRAGELDDEDVAQGAAGFRSLSWFGYRLAGARVPKDPKEQLKYMDLAIMGGKDLHMFPKLYVPYEQVAADAAKASSPIAKLRTLNPDRLAEVDSIVRRSGSGTDLGFLPLRAGKHDLTVVVRQKDGGVVALMPLRPWEY